MTVGSVRLGGEDFPIRKVLCVGRNYAAHAGEMGETVPDEPFFFLKPRTAVVRPDGGGLFVPASFGLLHHELELAVLLGAGGKDVSPADAPDLVAGYGIALDLTLRDLQSEAKRGGRPWTMSKGFDGSAPVGDFAPASTVPDPRDLVMSLTVNGAVRQKASTSRMVFDPAELISHASRYMTLEEGDLLLTGTPEGVGPLVEGDEVVATIGDLPALRLTVRRR
ncbi:MAG: fumarylacetoacetate hydrolase family protein [Candidatus Eisenbacteria bacterium]